MKPDNESHEMLANVQNSTIINTITKRLVVQLITQTTKQVIRIQYTLLDIGSTIYTYYEIILTRAINLCSISTIWQSKNQGKHIHNIITVYTCRHTQHFNKKRDELYRAVNMLISKTTILSYFIHLDLLCCQLYICTEHHNVKCL